MSHRHHVGIIICGPSQSRATKIIRHVQKLKSRDKSASIEWIKGHNNHPGNERAEHLGGKAAEEIEP
jgi:ribonuclease HI